MAYEKTLWKTGDIITEEKMNKIEEGIKSSMLQIVTITSNELDYSMTCSHSPSELNEMLQNNTPFIIMFKGMLCNFDSQASNSTIFRVWYKTLYEASLMGGSMRFTIYVLDINENKEVNLFMSISQTVEGNS